MIRVRYSQGELRPWERAHRHRVLRRLSSPPANTARDRCVGRVDAHRPGLCLSIVQRWHGRAPRYTHCRLCKYGGEHQEVGATDKSSDECEDKVRKNR